MTTTTSEWRARVRARRYELGALGAGLAGALAVATLARVALGQGAPADERARRRDEARAVLAARCDGCHQSGSKAANRAALGAFDLDRAGWADRLATRQVRQMPERIRRPAFRSSDDDRRRVDAFVAVELAARGERSPASP